MKEDASISFASFVCAILCNESFCFFVGEHPIIVDMIHDFIWNLNFWVFIVELFAGFF